MKQKLFIHFLFSVVLFGSMPPAFGIQDERELPFPNKEQIHHHAITTAMPQAQQYFDQGLILYFAFNHEEAIRSFREATRLDPTCAMAYWGIALAYGPNINRPMPEEAVPKAYAALQRAQNLADEVSDQEQAYIEALSKRYVPEAMEDRTSLDLAYAEAMRTVMRHFPDDLDAASLFAEALMNTMPWDYWTPDRQPKAATDEVIATLEGVLTRNPYHLGANHFYIHTVEAGPHPEQALASADRLRERADRLPDLVQGTGHLVHMPGHIYLRLGLYNAASRANERAIKADENYLTKDNAQSYYARLYYPHKYNYLGYTTMMEGRSEKALAVAKIIAAQVEDNFPVAERLRSLPLFVMARFGRWAEILAEPQPPAAQPFLTAMWHYARGLAYVASGQLDDARAEADQLETIANSEEAKSFEVPFFYGLSQIKIAREVLAAEIAGLQDQGEAMVGHFEKAVTLQDQLPYMEPPYWYFPVRQSLGAALLKVNQAEKAEAVYRKDLQKNPWNGWSLNGLTHTLHVQEGTDDAANEVQKQLERAWIRADVTNKYQ